jgi:hypothetical protein
VFAGCVLGMVLVASTDLMMLRVVQPLLNNFGAIDAGDVETMLDCLDPAGFDIHVLAPDAHLADEAAYREWQAGIADAFARLRHTVVALAPRMTANDAALVELSIHSEVDRRAPGPGEAPRVNVTLDIVWDLTRHAGSWRIARQQQATQASPAFGAVRAREFAVTYLHALDRRDLPGRERNGPSEQARIPPLLRHERIHDRHHEVVDALGRHGRGRKYTGCPPLRLLIDLRDHHEFVPSSPKVSLPHVLNRHGADDEIGRRLGLAGPLDPGPLGRRRRLPGNAAARGVHEFDGPSLEHGRRGDQVAGGSRHRGDDASRMADEGIHQAAFAGVHPPGEHHPPRPREPQSHPRCRPQPRGQFAGRGPLAAGRVCGAARAVARYSWMRACVAVLSGDSAALLRNTNCRVTGKSSRRSAMPW